MSPVKPLSECCRCSANGRSAIGAEEVELLALEDSGIHVAEYLTALPARELLEEKLVEAVRRAKVATTSA